MDKIIDFSGRFHIQCAVFDFDGTLSKLRAGWEEVMEPMMCELIPGEPNQVLTLVKKYIDESTGIQTILQMQWLADTIQARGGIALDPWEYKNIYLQRLMQTVEQRKTDVITGKTNASLYKVFGSDNFLARLQERGIKMYAASGTDEEDVQKEAAILGFDKYFTDIRGAKNGSFACSKEAVLRDLVSQNSNMLVVGDGKVEIKLGREVGALTLGVASNDIIGCDDCDINMAKYNRLKNAGAHIIVSDFRETEEIMKLI